MQIFFQVIMLCVSLTGVGGLYADSQDETPLLPHQKGGNKYQSILTNSTWIVPPQTLTAVQYIDGKAITVTDDNAGIDISATLSS
jgi:hypothetical protein